MKKFFIAFSAFAILLSATSCENKKSETENNFNDSLSMALGTAVGSNVASQLSNIPQAEKNKFSKTSILKGIQTILASDTSDHGYMAGLNIGMQLMMRDINGASMQGAEINKELLLENLKAALDSDSISQEDIQKNFLALQALMGQLREKYQKQQDEIKAKSPEAIQNTKTGEAFINKMKKQDPEIQTTSSGLSYKIIAKGDDTKINKTDRVSVKYKGSLIDGKVFDDSGDEARTFRVSGVVPGFGEGLMLLGKGGKATLYIPGNLGYGVNGNAPAGIGPNQTLIFDIEIVDINAEPVSPSAGASTNKKNSIK